MGNWKGASFSQGVGVGGYTWYNGIFVRLSKNKILMALNKNTAGGFTFINRLSSTKLLKYASFRTVSGAIVDWGGGGGVAQIC